MYEKKDVKKMMEKIVSIVIPVYNGEKYLEETISQILQSTYEKLEIIVIDDGSTDHSKNICNELQKKDDRIHFYTRENGGVASARNYGANRANGDYLCFCDQDDIVAIEFYEKMVARFEKDKSDICMCSTGRNIEGKTSVYELFDDEICEDDKILKHLLLPLLFNGYNAPIEMNNVNRYPHIWNCMFSMAFWKKNNFQFRSYINYEDDLLLKVDALTKARKVSTISYLGYYWRINLKSESYVHKFVDNMAFKQQQCYEDMRHCLEYKITDSYVLKLFEEVTMCKQYLDAIHNITSPMLKKNLLFIRQYYQQTIYCRNFQVSIKMRKYLKKGRIKPMILLPLVAKRLTIMSYLAEKILDHVLLFSLRSQTLTRIERKLKL